MRALTAAIFAASLIASGCAHRPAAPTGASVAPPASEPVSQTAALAAAHEQVRRGCYDCLRAALDGYVGLLDDPQLAPAAREGAVRSALLLAVRENELGMVDGGYLNRARQLLGPPAEAPLDLLSLAEIADLLATGPAGGSRAAMSDRQLKSMLQLAQTQEQWSGQLRARVPEDLVASYLWVGVVCGPYGSRAPGRDTREDVIGPLLSVPLIAYKHWTACGVSDREPLEALVAADPGFREVDYFLGLFALGSQRHVEPNLDLADAHFTAATSWREAWPSAGLALAQVAMLEEDFPRAFELFDRTLAIAPEDPEALVGLVRSLTYQDRHSEAIAAADRLLASGRNPGDAHYWRALNLARLKQYDAAWDDIEKASAAMANADVPKLAGIIAMNRREMAVARQRLELAQRRRRGDCETGFYLQSILAEQREWDAVASIAADSAACFQSQEALLQQELDALRAGEAPDARRLRQIARRDDQRASYARMRESAWFNAAVANFNLARRPEAALFAQKLADHEYFGERARALLDRLKH